MTADIPQFCSKNGQVTVRLPAFIPVYRPDFTFELFSSEAMELGLSAVMVNAFLLYKDQELRQTFQAGHTLREHLGGFGGLLCTDSGAFQQLGGRRIALDPLEIIRFQNLIQTDIAAPLDLITPPQTGYEETLRRLIISQNRIEEAFKASWYSDLAGIQQGGGFFALRQRHIRELAAMGLRYYGIGSMVPFFNKNHDLYFTCAVIRDARKVVGPNPPIHVYGAGDPLDMLFMYLAGANIFDSSSYAHYAKGGYYMTPFGAVNKRAFLERLSYSCDCPVCHNYPLAKIFDLQQGEALRETHNLLTLLATAQTMQRLSGGSLSDYSNLVYQTHIDNLELFPNSRLAQSWELYLTGQIESFAHLDPELGPKPKSPPAIPTPPLTSLENQLLRLLSDDCARSYKMKAGEVFELILEQLTASKNAKFRKKISKASDIKEILRLSDYHAFRKTARTEVYQRLRRYKPSGDQIEVLTSDYIESSLQERSQIENQLLLSHVSTRERFSYRVEFEKLLIGLIPDGGTVIDLGCGFNPLLLSPKFYARLAQYSAIDRDPQALEIVRLYAAKNSLNNLRTYAWDISEGLDVLEAITGKKRYDLALILKVIAALNRSDSIRQNPDHREPGLAVLGEFPTEKILATVCQESMTKFESIKNRELSLLNRFVKDFQLKAISDFSLGTELGYVLTKMSPPD
ncbi:MAG: tRNA-guanine transglycosylase [Deltaproteobacteria bacterium]|jgi:tRNA-guanine family transglycosylase|nr:tRNA-guanine transglycosylase [Deltaproteobacteria bacterium]